MAEDVSESSLGVVPKLTASADATTTTTPASSSSSSSPSNPPLPHSTPPAVLYKQWLPKPEGTQDPRTLPLALPPSALAALSSACPLPSDVFSLVRQWTGQQREKLCPPSSYSALTRSSYALVDAAACVGFAALTLLRRADVFHRVVACETNDEWADALTLNASVYGRSDRVTVHRSHVMAYFHQRYHTDNRFASVYWDPAIPSTPPLSLAPSGDDYLFDPPLTIPTQPELTFDSLSSCCSRLLSHPTHPVPLLLLKLPAAFDTTRLCSLARNSAHEAAIAKSFGFKFLILAGAAPAASPVIDPAVSDPSAFFDLCRCARCPHQSVW